MIAHLAWSVIRTVKTNFIVWENRNWSWKPANFSTKPLKETQWKQADTFKSMEALRKHETMPPFSSYTFPVETVLRKRNGILNHQVSATFPNCGNTLFHRVRVLKCTILSATAVKVSVYCSAQKFNGRTQNLCSVHSTHIWRVIPFFTDYAPMHKMHVSKPQMTKMRVMIPE